MANQLSADGQALPSESTKKDSPKGKKRLSKDEKNGLEWFLAILLVSLIVYVAIVAIAALLFWYSFSTPASSTSLYSLKVVDAKEGTTLYTSSASRSNNSYGLYVYYSDLSEYCDFGIAGDEEEITLFLTDSDTIVCYANSSLISVNSNIVRLSAPILFEDGDYLLPISLFENYLDGMNVEYDDKKSVCTLSLSSGSSFSLKMTRPEALDKLSSFDLGQFDSSVSEDESSN